MGTTFVHYALTLWAVYVGLVTAFTEKCNLENLECLKCFGVRYLQLYFTLFQASNKIGVRQVKFFVSVKPRHAPYPCFHCDSLIFLTIGWLYFTDTSRYFPDYSSTDDALDPICLCVSVVTGGLGWGGVLSVKTLDREGETLGIMRHLAALQLWAPSWTSPWAAVGKKPKAPTGVLPGSQAVSQPWRGRAEASTIHSHVVVFEPVRKYVK